MAEDFCCFLNSDALLRMKFAVKRGLPVSLWRGQSVQHGVCGGQQRVCGGEGQAAKGRSREPLAPMVRMLSGASWRLGSDPSADLQLQVRNPWASLLWGGWGFLPSYTFYRNRTQIVRLAFHPVTDPKFFQAHENVLRQRRKTISHPAPPTRWKQSLVGSCCLLTLALGEIIIIGQKWACFSDCSFSSLLALWDFLFIDKETAASPVSVQRNCNCLHRATLS